MLKKYSVGGRLFQYEEGEQPANAIEIGKVEPVDEKAEHAVKPVKPVNKARAVKKK